MLKRAYESTIFFFEMKSNDMQDITVSLIFAMDNLSNIYFFTESLLKRYHFVLAIILINKT